MKLFVAICSGLYRPVGTLDEVRTDAMVLAVRRSRVQAEWVAREWIPDMRWILAETWIEEVILDDERGILHQVLLEDIANLAGVQ